MVKQGGARDTLDEETYGCGKRLVGFAQLPIESRPVPLTRSNPAQGVSWPGSKLGQARMPGRCLVKQGARGLKIDGVGTNTLDKQ